MTKFVVFVFCFLSVPAFAVSSDEAGGCLQQIVTNQVNWPAFSSDQFACAQNESRYVSAVGLLCASSGRAISVPYQKYLDYQSAFMAEMKTFMALTDPAAKGLQLAKVNISETNWRIFGYKIEVGYALVQMKYALEDCQSAR